MVFDEDSMNFLRILYKKVFSDLESLRVTELSAALLLSIFGTPWNVLRSEVLIFQMRDEFHLQFCKWLLCLFRYNHTHANTALP